MHANSWNPYPIFLLGYWMGGLGGLPPRIRRKFENDHWIRANLGTFGEIARIESQTARKMGGAIAPLPFRPVRLWLQLGFNIFPKPKFPGITSREHLFPGNSREFPGNANPLKYTRFSSWKCPQMCAIMPLVLRVMNAWRKLNLWLKDMKIYRWF